ncbi:MAG: hypothetical protein RBT60_03230 [Candidatus Krumholzibacteria bacterium]|nr:hypothetical protein [Candidatus Krumholzibacteria bacterium]
MRRSILLLATGCLSAMVLLAACNKENKKQPLSELDQFSAGYRALPAAAALDSFTRLSRGPLPQSTYAKYEVGNIYYAMANDTAQSRGWNDARAQALLDSAEVWLNAALAADSTFVEAYVNLGALWDDRADMPAVRAERDSRIGKARANYERALELRPQDDKARCNLGTLHKRENNLELAKKEFLTALEYNPRSALARYNLAILFATMRIYREALTEFELAVKYDPQGDIGERSRANIKIIQDLMAGEASRAERPK